MRNWVQFSMKLILNKTGEELGMTGFVLDHENNGINELRIELDKLL